MGDISFGSFLERLEDHKKKKHKIISYLESGVQEKPKKDNYVLEVSETAKT